jgi:hypothetical protein
MDWKRYQRDASKVHAVLVEQPDNSVMTTRGVKIYVPERFSEKQLAVIGAETYIVGIFAIVVDDLYYGVSTANAMMRIKPSLISTVKFDDSTYLEFSFEAGSTVIATTELIKTDTLVYRIFDEMIAKGHVPWYLSYDDLAKLFETAEYHAGMRLTRSHAILEMIAAAVARDPQDRTKYYRHSVVNQADERSRPPVVIPLRSITYGATNTTSKLLGSYWDQGLTSALVNPSTKVENIEDLLRR